MANFVLQGDISSDRAFPLPKNEYDEAMQRVLHDFINDVTSILNNTETGVELDNKVKASSTDATAGYLDAKVKNSIEVDSDDLQLVNDASAPGNEYVYATNGSGIKGWHLLSSLVETIPSGIISMWSGAISAIPTGWVICDGNNSTPDLTDRFVIHADADSGGTNDVGDTGGASTHNHGIGSYVNSTDGSHTHTRGAAGSGPWYGGANDGYTISTTGDHTHTISGDSETVSNVPKYYALAYIMKS